MNTQPNSEQTIGNLTRTQLEEIIKDITRKTIEQEIINVKNNKSEALEATFGSWEDERTEEKIIKEIYESRNSNLR